ncbi:hypothetical protein [Paraburkholderia caffeinilytica]|uniref:hypothetical protein n=1 Tax=Paraburkholderia caffeinilytica TaxID=1761016 RepID=UPI001ABFF827|nr:hypothetical protein [Paraburkholderia caffeinilytica]
MNALASLPFSFLPVVTTSEPMPMRRKWRALAGNAFSSRSSFAWTAEADLSSAVPVLYLIMKRSLDASDDKPLVFIFNDIGRGTLSDEAANAAVCSSVGVVVAAAVSLWLSLPLLPPHAVSASEKDKQAAPIGKRRVFMFDHSVPIPVTALRAPFRAPSCFSLCISFLPRTTWK